MSDGGQTLLDVIEDPNVLDSFFNVTDPYTTDQTLDSPSYDNATASSDSAFTNNSLENIAFDSLSENGRSGVNPIIQKAINSSIVAASSGSGYQLFPHQLQNDILQTPHHPGIASPIVGNNHDISHSREPCNRSDLDQTSLQQLLSNSQSLANYLNVQTNQSSHHSNLTQVQSGAQNVMLQHHHSRQHGMQKSHGLLNLGSEQNLELTSNLLHNHPVATTLSNRAISVSQPICNQVVSQDGSHSDGTLSSKNNTSVSQSFSLSGYGKVLVSGPGQVVSPNIFNSSAQVISGASLLPGNQVLPTSGVLPGGRVYQGGNAIEGSNLLSHVINNSRVTSAGGINPQHVSPQNAGLSSQTTMILTSSSTTISSPCIGSLPLVNSSTPGPSTFVLPSVSSTLHASKISTHMNSSPSLPSRSSIPTTQAVVIKKSAINQSMQSTSFMTQTPSGIPSVPLDVSNLVSNVHLAARTVSNNISVTQAVVTTCGQTATTTVKQMSGGHVLQIVNAAQSKQTIVHQAPKPIQPKPQILPKPNLQCNVRQPTPPPAGKTLIGSRPAPPISQQSIVIGANQQPTVIGPQALGGLVLNPIGQNIFNQNTFLIPQGNGQPILFRLAPPAAPTNPAILAPVGASSMVPMNKITQPQTFVLPPAGQPQSIVFPQGLTNNISGNISAANLFSPPRAQQPVYRYVTNPAPLQIQQIQTATGTTFIAIPAPQTSLNLSNVLAPTTVRAIGSPVSQTPFQLASIGAATPSQHFGGIQIAGANYQTFSNQSMQASIASIANKTITSTLQPPVIVNSNQLAVAGPSTMETPSTSSVAAIKSPAADRNSRRTKKKKKQSPDDNREGETYSEINLQDIIADAGINDSDVMFDDSEFNDMVVETPLPQPVAPHEQVIGTSSTVTSHLAQTAATHQLPNAIPGLENMCLTLDQEGKLILSQPEVAKSLGTVALQQPASNLLQNMQIVNSGNMNNNLGETVILGGSNDRGQLSLESASKQGQILTVTNSAGGQTLMKLGPPSSIQSKMTDGGDNRAINVLLNTVNEKGGKNPLLTSMLIPDTQLNGVESAQFKAGFSKIPNPHKQNVPSGTILSAVKDVTQANATARLNSAEVSKRQSAMSLTFLGGASKSGSEGSDVDKNTYQHKYIESVKPLVPESKSRNKKTNKKKKKDKYEELSTEQLGANGMNRRMLPSAKFDPADFERRDEVKEISNVPGASMPSLSFMTSPMAGSSKSAINTTTVSVTKCESAALTKISASGVFSPPGNYIVSGHAARPQNSTPQRIGQPTTFQIVLSPQNQEAYKKIVSQIQTLSGKTSMTEQEKLIWPKLVNEYNRIMSLAKPAPSSTSSSKNMVITQRNAIKYSHSIGHKKIILTPTQKKGSSPSVHPQTKERFNDQFKNDMSTASSQTIPMSHTPVVTMCSSATNTSTPRISDRVKENKSEKMETYPQSSFSSISSASSDGFSPRIISPHQRLCDSFFNKAAPGNSNCPLRPNAQLAANSGYMCTTPNMSASLRQSFIQPLTRHQLFEHQMRTDQNGAFNPDYKSPFKNRTDCCKRTIRFHMMSGKDLTAQEVAESDQQFETQADTFQKKFDSMSSKYQSLVLKDSMQRNASAEQAMLLRLVNQEEKNTTEREKAEARCNQGSREEILPLIFNRRPINSSYVDGHPWEDTWCQEKIYRRNSITGLLEKVPIPADDATPDRPESEEPRLQILTEEEIDRRTPESDESIARIARTINSNLTSSDTDSRSPFVPEMDLDRCPMASTSHQWNGMPKAPMTNGTERTNSSPESAWPTAEVGGRREKKKKTKSKHRNRSRKRKERFSAQEPEGDLPESPSTAPIKLVFKKREGKGYYSSSQPESLPEQRHGGDAIENKSKRRRTECEADENQTTASGSAVQVRFNGGDPAAQGHPTINYRSSNTNYLGLNNSNFNFRYS